MLITEASSPLFTHGAAVFESQLGGSEVGNPTSGVVPVETSDSDLRNEEKKKSTTGMHHIMLAC